MSSCGTNTITGLVPSETTQLDRVLELVADRDAYRVLAQQAIHYCHARQIEFALLCARHERLISEYRALREQMMPRD